MRNKENIMEEIIKKKDTLLIPFILALAGSLIMVISIFLPYATATEEQAERFETYPDTVIVEELGLTAKDMVNISMFTYARVYVTISEEAWGEPVSGIFYAVIVGVIALFSGLALLFSILKKPIPIMIFDIIATVIFIFQCQDYTGRGVIPSDSYNWGIAYYIFFIAAVVVLASSVWMLVGKIKAKKQANTDDSSTIQNNSL